jgi:iron complex outermembrane recepter protein
MRNLIATLLYIAANSLFAQTGSVQGKVKTADGQPAPHVNVILKGEGKGTSTDHDGQYLIKGIKPGSYIVSVSFVGMQTQEKAVTIIAGQVAQLEFDLLEDSQTLASIEVTSSRGLNETPVSVGKIAINPMEMPQSTMVLDRSILEKQQSSSLGDVLMNANGVYVMGTSGGSQQELAGRGFSFGSSNTFKNGVRFNNGIMPEISSLERVEILKGSGALLFGQVGAGGVLNIVTKKPKFEHGGELGFKAGSYSFFKPTFDLYGSLDERQQLAYRVNMAYENTANFRDRVESERIYFNPSFLIKAGKKTEILIEGDYLKDNRTLDFGTAAINYQIADLPRSLFLNTSWAYFKAEQKTATVTVKHDLSDSWQIRLLGSYQDFEQDQYGTTRPNASGYFVQEDGTWVRGLQRSGTEQNYYLAQLDVTGKFKTGSMEHHVLIGVDVDQYANKSLTYSYRNAAAANKNVYDTINVYDLSLRAQRHDVPDIARNTTTENPINRAGIYVQDHITLLPQLKALVGLRYSYVDTRSTVYTAANQVSGTPTKNFPSAWSPRVGLVYQPFKSTSLFASYSNSFDVNIGIDTLGSNSLPPSIINQYEVGVKNEFWNGLLAFNVAAYQIDNSNSFLAMTTIQPTRTWDSQAKASAGSIRSKGFEVDIMSRSIHGFSVISGYSYNDTRYTESLVFVKGSRLRYNPQHTANLSVFYNFPQNTVLKHFSLGMNSQYIGNRVAGRSTRTNIVNDSFKLMTVPDYMLFDGSLSYALERLVIRARVSNIFNVLSYNVHDDNSVNPIAPRQFSAAISYRL